MAKPTAKVRAFRDISCELLTKLMQELETLEKDLDDDFDKNDLQVFVLGVISNFSDLQAGLHSSKLFAGYLGILNCPEVRERVGEMENLQTFGLKLMRFLVLKGRQAKTSDFVEAQRLVASIALQINHIITDASQPAILIKSP